MGTQLPPPKKRGTASQFSACVHCGQTAGWMKMLLGRQEGLDPGDNVRWGPSSSPHKGWHRSPQFSAHVLWPNGRMIQDASWYEGRLWPWPHCIIWGRSCPKDAQPSPILGPCLLVMRKASAQATLLDGTQLPSPKGTAAPNFRPMYCGQTAGWMKMPLGMEVGLGPSHMV